MANLSDGLTAWRASAGRIIDRVAPHPRIEEIGHVTYIGDGVAGISGLARAGQDELLRFDGGGFGMAVTLEPESIGAVLLSPWQSIAAGGIVRGIGEVVRTPVGEELLGRVVDPLGQPLDGGPPLSAVTCEPIERPAPAIVDRDLITRPLATGITVIDAMLPVGRGQRELIIGDRKTGKTAIAAETIINQRDSGVVCVYAAIGQKSSTVNRLIETVRQLGDPGRCVFVVAAPDGPPGLAWLAPYAACTIAEFFRDRGEDALLVIDDLTKHAAIHRQLSLLLHRPPGREAYPGDIFYAHSRLLERGAQLNSDRGGGSLTILPIAETQGGNLSAFIPTNLISITDGQIILEPKLFYEGQRPAVDVGKSVSRVGGKTQAPALKALASHLRLQYAQFLELEVFTRFGGMIDAHTRGIVDHGQRIRAMLIQAQGRPRALPEQVAGVLALSEGLLDALPMPAVMAFQHGLAGWLMRVCPDIGHRIARTGTLEPADRAILLEHLAGWVATLDRATPDGERLWSG